MPAPLTTARPAPPAPATISAPAGSTGPVAEPAAGGVRGRTAQRHVSTYSDLLRRAQDAGLMERRRGSYAVRIALTLTALAATVTGVVVVGDSWYQLILAAVLAFVLTQVAFLGHDAAHKQIFSSLRVNEWGALVLTGLLSGLSYTWWMSKHSRHHGMPNQVGKDPDIASKVLVFSKEDGDARRGLAARLTSWQGTLFLPMLLMEGANLHIHGVKQLVGRNPGQRRIWVERAFISVRLFGYVAALFAFLPPGKAAAFLGLQVGLFGLFLGGSFAPNHIGMPIVPRGVKVDFLHRQVVMSRNVSGGWLVDLVMGGLNYQIEHHLFPNMPRVNLRAVRPMVREHCAELGVPYTETSFFGAYRDLLGYLNRVGVRAADPFRCPLATQLRGGVRSIAG